MRINRDTMDFTTIWLIMIGEQSASISETVYWNSNIPKLLYIILGLCAFMKFGKIFKQVLLHKLVDGVINFNNSLEFYYSVHFLILTILYYKLSLYLSFVFSIFRKKTILENSFKIIVNSKNKVYKNYVCLYNFYSFVFNA